MRIAELLCVLFAFGLMPANASESNDVRLLTSSPPCVKERLGQVSVSLGSTVPNERTGMRPSSVSYQRAFRELREAASEKGGEAVVLRSHEAGFFTKSARKARRPTFLSLKGAVVTLEAHGVGCPLAMLDPAGFERDAMGRERGNVVLDRGVSF